MDKTRFTIDLGTVGGTQIQKLADEEGVTKAEIFRRAVAIYALIKRETKPGDIPNVALLTKGDEIALKIAVL